MGVDRIGGRSPSLNLLRDALSVGWSKDTELGGGAKGGWEIIEQGEDGVGEASGSEDAGAE